MFDRTIVTILLCTALPSVALRAVQAQSNSTSKAEVKEAWNEKGWPLVERFCLDCHNDFYQEAELDLTRFETLDGIADDGETMSKVLNMIRFGAMPPEDYDLPTDDERQTLGDVIDETIFAVTCDLRPRPGKVTARRLNRAEYNHTIRDLFGLDLKPAEDFPSDEVGGGFDNNGDVLSLSPMLIDKYLTAAQSVAKQVVLDPESLPSLDTQRPGDQIVIEGDSKTGSFYGRFLAPDAFAWTEVEIPVDGEYEVDFRGGTTVEDAPDGKFALFDRDGLLRAVYEVEYYGGGGKSNRDSARFKLEKGKQRFIIVPVKDDDDLEIGKSRFDRISELDDKRIKRGRKKLGDPLMPERRFKDEEYPFMIRRLSIEGPTKLHDSLFPPSHDQIIRARPNGRGDRAKGVTEAAVKCLRPLMRRAFRGPVSEAEAKPYAELVAQAMKRDESFERGLQIAISAVLVSPKFLFRVETPPEDEKIENDGQLVRLTQHQLASRLSYFLWSSTPDDALLSAADAGKLRGDSLSKHVLRMLNDERSEALAGQFAAQWLGLRNLEGHTPDAERFNGFDLKLLPLMSKETKQFFLHTVQENRPVAELLTADYSFLNEALAEYYGIKGIEGERFRRVSLEGTPRRGLLGHASVLTLTSEPTRTSPVKRGKWILENILGTPPPEPPSGVPELGETKTAAADATLREQLELHREDPSCAACHRVMDQLGFGLENFDAVGQFRERDGKAKIDASGVLPGGRNFAGAAELSSVLGQSEREAFAKTVVQRLLGFALGRELTLSDRCTVDEIVQETAATNHRMVDLIMKVIESRPFQYYEWAPIAANN